jgi:hypothetical protein
MMHDLLNAQKAAAQQATQGRASTRQGVISSYDPNAYAVKVMLQPDNVPTGWIPLKSAWIGNGWGLFCPPSIGDAVEVDFQEDDGGVGSAGLRFFNDSDRPLPCPSGEFWLVHKSGSLLKFHNDGTVELTAAATMTYTATQHHFVGPVQMDNTLNVNDNVTCGKNITAAKDIADQGGSHTMAGMRGTYNGHHHGSSPTPDASM